MIDTRLKVFRSVATHLSFTKAANELFISQPAISKHIAEFRKQYPDIRLTLLSGNCHEIEDALATGRINLGMVEGIKRQPTFKYTPFMKDELVA